MPFDVGFPRLRAKQYRGKVPGQANDTTEVDGQNSEQQDKVPAEERCPGTVAHT